MRVLTLLLSILVVTSFSCSRRDCGCTPPPGGETTWKITSRYGGIDGKEIPLTQDEKIHTLTLHMNGVFNCKNKITGHNISGSITTSDFNSIYGNRLRLVFSTPLPILKDEYLVLVQKEDRKMLFGDNIADGYMTVMEPVQ